MNNAATMLSMMYTANCANKVAEMVSEREKKVDYSASELAYKRGYEKGFADGDTYHQGMWDMFESITSACFGKQYYFRDDSGMVYSRLSHKYFPSAEGAYTEFHDYLQGE